MKMRPIIIVIICFFAVNSLQAQDYIFNSHFNFPINEKHIYYRDINTSLRPATGSEHEVFDSIIFRNYENKSGSIIKRKLFYEHLIISESDEHKVIINPIFDFRANKSVSEDRSGFLNTRGVVAYANINSKIWVNSSFYENQGVFPSHIDELYQKYLIIPGYSRVKEYKDSGYDFMTAYGSISAKPYKTLTFTFGTDRLFIGDGYRSMLLSDYSCANLFLKSSWQYKNIGFNHILTHTLNPNYNNIMGIDENWSINSIYPGKLISYNYLTWNINKLFQLGFFEAVVFDARSENIWNYAALNPVNYLNTAMLGFDNIDNVLAGLNFSYQNRQYGVLYSQFLIDKLGFNSYDSEKYSNRLAWQLGYKNFNLFGVKNLYFQVEYNHADVLTYTHSSPTQHYGHFNQPLAHPAGHGFDEIVFITKYQYSNFEIFTKLNCIKYDYAGDFDMKNIYNQEEFKGANVFISPGNKVLYSDTQFIYHINPAIGMQIFGGVIIRKDILFGDENIFVQFGLRTALRANYYDY